VIRGQGQGFRQSPVLVVEVVRSQEIVHYIAPPPEGVGAILNGLATSLKCTEGQYFLMHSALGAFGFV
jgi:hypothetical protein